MSFTADMTVTFPEPLFVTNTSFVPLSTATPNGSVPTGIDALMANPAPTDGGVMTSTQESPVATQKVSFTES